LVDKVANGACPLRLTSEQHMNRQRLKRACREHDCQTSGLNMSGRLAQTTRPMPFPRSTAAIAAPCCSLAASDVEERAGDEGSLGACQP
jgi:hypothetical protein